MKTQAPPGSADRVPLLGGRQVDGEDAGEDAPDPSWRELEHQLLNKGERRRLLKAGAHLSLASVMEAGAIAAIYPFINALIRETSTFAPGPAGSSSFLTSIDLIPAGIALLTFYLLKNSLVAWSAFDLQRAVADIRTGVTDRTFSQFMRESFATHATRDLAEVQRLIQLDAAMLVSMGVQQGLLLFAESLVVVLMLAVLMLIAPLATLLIFAVAGIALVAWQLTLRRRLTRYGEDSQAARRGVIRAIGAGLRSFKEARVLGVEKHFEDQVHDATVSYGRAQAFHDSIAEVPRLILEILMIGALVLGGWHAASGGELTAADVATIGVYLSAGFRIVPSINRIARATSTLRYVRPGLVVLGGVLERGEDTAHSPRPVPRHYRSVELADLSLRYPNAPKPAVSGVSLEINRGEVLSIVGPSGSGKTTLVDVLIGLLEPTSGTLAWSGDEDEGGEDAICAYVPQTPYIETGTVRDNLELGLPMERRDDARYWSALEAVGLADEIRAKPDALDHPVGEAGNRLSGGQRQRLALARSLARGAHFIILDEPTAALDSDSASKVMDAWCNLGPDTTVIVVTHDPAAAARTERVIRVQDGRILENVQTV